MKLPELRMGSYLAFEGLGDRDGLVPVRVDPLEPVMGLSYADEMEACDLLIPSHPMLGEWVHLSLNYRIMLEEAGVGAIAKELWDISGGHGGKPLVLLDHDSPSRGTHGDTTPRVVFAEWWERETGEPVPELLAEGATLHYTELPRRVQPVQAKDWTKDRRWRDAPEVPWPPTEEDVLRWVEAVHWQTARSKGNPHQYNVFHWSPGLSWRRVVQWIRETGEAEVWGKQTYLYRRIGDHKYWSMGHSLSTTIILNRKVFGADPGDREETSRRSAPAIDPGPVEAPLFGRDGRPLTLAERINAEHRACSLAVGAAVHHALRCGGLLREAKAGVRHGEWLPWLAANFEGSPRTAQLYMGMSRDRSFAGAARETGTTPQVPNTQRVTYLGEEANHLHERRESA